MNEARFWFDAKFDVFLPPERREVEFSYSFKGNPSVKHLIEAMRVPHTEVGQVIINENVKSITDWVQNGDFIVVCPVDCDKLKNADRVIREAQGVRPRFILDNHLGKLATYLRMLGFDTLYRNDYQDEELAARASQQERILLTRDRGLLMRREIAYGYYIRSMMPQDQIVEVLKRYQIVEEILPFKRCLRCNDVLLPVEKALILDRLEPLTRTHYDEFHQCWGCHQIYWKGSHYERMLRTIDELKTKAGG
jgi:hypothetical protein